MNREPEYVWVEERLLVVWSLRDTLATPGRVDRRHRKPPTRVQDALRAEEWSILLKIQEERDGTNFGELHT
jgi:hypothetical protein